MSITEHDDRRFKTNSDLLILLYQIMLQRIPEQAVEAFWSAHPLPDQPGNAPLSATLESLWTTRKRYPSRYVFQVAVDAESLLCRHGLSLERSIDASMSELRRGHMLPMRLITRLFVAASPLLTATGDLRRGLLRVGELMIRLNSPEACFHVFGTTADEAQRREYVITSPDAHLQAGFPAWDVHATVGAVLRHNPRLLGLRRYEEVESLSHMRDLRAIGAAHVLPHRPEGAAEQMTLRTFLARRGIPTPPGLELPDDPVQVATETLCCSRCGASVVTAGAAYGARCHVFRVTYAMEHHDLARSLLRFSKAVAHPPPLLAEVSLRHRALLERLRTSNRLLLRFDRAGERLYSEATLVTRGATSIMLAAMLRELASRGTEEFQRQFLVKAAGLDPHNPSFEIRIRRLAASLERTCPALRLTRAARGIWRLQCTVPFRIDEYVARVA